MFISLCLKLFSLANIPAQLASSLKSSGPSIFGTILFVNVLTSPIILLSSYAIRLESSPPLKNTPIFLNPILHIFTVLFAICLYSLGSNNLFEMGLIKILFVCFIVLFCML